MQTILFELFDLMFDDRFILYNTRVEKLITNKNTPSRKK